jgi:hypothetical protein
MERITRKLRPKTAPLPLLTNTKQGVAPPPPPPRPPPPPSVPRGNATYRGIIHYRLSVRISNQTKRLDKHFTILPGENIWERLLEDVAMRVGQGIAEYGGTWEILINPMPTIRYVETATNVETIIDYRTIRMMGDTPMNLSVNIFANIVPIEPTEESCVPTALRKLYPEISKQKKDPIALLHNANTNEIIDFCKTYKIRMIAWDHLGNVIAKYIPDKPSTKFKTLAYVVYDNHIHIVKNKELVKKPLGEKFEIVEHEQLQRDFKELILRRIEPSNIRLGAGDLIAEYTHEDTRYIVNPDWELVLHISNVIGLFEDTLDPSTTLSQMLIHLEKYYSSTNTSSFFPIEHRKPAFFWTADSIDPDREKTTIDKNLAYTDILMTLPYLLKTDIRTHTHEDTTEYTEELSLYLAEAIPPNILMPKKDLYSGSHIKYCIQLKAFEVKIYERMECEKERNHFQLIIEDLLTKFNRDHIKKLVLPAIGLFEKTPEIKEKIEVSVIGEDERTNQYEDVRIDDLDGKYLQKRPTKVVRNLYNRKPIAIQIKDTMYRLLFEKMRELKLTDDDIVNINTDSITFYSQPNQQVETSKDIGKWKKADYNPRHAISFYDTQTPFPTMRQVLKTPMINLIVQGPPGNGKSHRIQNNTDLTDAIILSSKHSAIRQHKEKGLNAKVIQVYRMGLKKAIPTEKHIIVEECGILAREHWDLLIECSMLGKQISVLGDFKQLLPVNEYGSFNQPLFLNWLFPNQETMNTNWRNKFSLGYYDWLLEKATKQELETEVIKYSTKKPQDADIIVAYRKEIVRDYNREVLKYKKFKPTDPYVPIMIKTNEFRDKELFNNFIFDRHELEEHWDDDQLEELLEEKGADKESKVQVAYTRTLYNMQGDETPTFYVAREDMGWFVQPRMAYTLISRLKGDMTEDIKNDWIDERNAQYIKDQEQRQEARRQEEQDAILYPPYNHLPVCGRRRRVDLPPQSQEA